MNVHMPLGRFVAARPVSMPAHFRHPGGLWLVFFPALKAQSTVINSVDDQLHSAPFIGIITTEHTRGTQILSLDSSVASDLAIIPQL